MKTATILAAGLLLPLSAVWSQSPDPGISASFMKKSLQPVQWKYEARKVNDTLYELHLTAFVQNGWHIYSQHQPEDAVAIPTAVRFDSHPSLTLHGKTREKGRLEKFTDPSIGISAWQYSDTVDFIQTVALKGDLPGGVGGSITFQACTQEQCLPPETVRFSIALKN